MSIGVSVGLKKTKSEIDEASIYIKTALERSCISMRSTLLLGKI